MPERGRAGHAQGSAARRWSAPLDEQPTPNPRACHRRSGLPIPPVTFPGIEQFTLEEAALYPALVEARVHKTPGEIELMRYVNRVGSEAHIAMMQVWGV